MNNQSTTSEESTDQTEDGEDTQDDTEQQTSSDDEQIAAEEQSSDEDATQDETTSEEATAEEQTTEEEDQQGGVVAAEKPEEAAPTVEEEASTEEEESEEQETTENYVVYQDPDPQNLLFGDSDIQDKGEPRAKNREYFTIAFLISAFALILLIILIRRCIEDHFLDALVQRLNSIMKDTILVISVITFALYLEFAGVFTWRLNMNGISLATLAFALIWLTISAVIVAISQIFCAKWRECETNVSAKGTLNTF